MVITIIVIEEILMANGLTVLMMCYLLSCRRKNRESLHTEDKVYDGIAKVNILGAVAETISFLVDGKSFMEIFCLRLSGPITVHAECTEEEFHRFFQESQRFLLP